MSNLTLAADGIDLSEPLPGGVSGTVVIGVIDTDRTGGNDHADTITLDELFVRTFHQEPVRVITFGLGELLVVLLDSVSDEQTH